MLLPAMLRKSAEKHPDSLAITINETGSTFAELLDASLLRAYMLQSLGVSKGDAIGLLIPNSQAFLQILLGAAVIGAVVVPINTRFKSAEIAHITRDASLKFIFTSDLIEDHVNFRNLLRESLLGLAGAADPSNLCLDGFPALKSAILIGNTIDADFLSDKRLLEEAISTDQATESAALIPEDPLLILYTSGTTARPKGCIITGKALAASANGVVKHFGIGANDVWWCPLPMFHIGGILFMTVCLRAAAHFVGMTRFVVESALDQIAMWRPTILYPLFPTIAIPLIKHARFKSTPTDSVRLIVCVAPTAVQSEIQGCLPGAVLISAFGMTETTGIVTLHRETDSLEARSSTVGSSLPGWAIKIVDSATREVLGSGKRGEIAVRGPGLFSGYLNDPALTARSFDEEGYFYTGDWGELSANGQLTFWGRLKDQFKVGGENVSALEVESYLIEHPHIRMAQVVGIPDPHYGEVPVAFIELSNVGSMDAQDIFNFCRGKMASFKIPKHIRFVTSWPMSATKIQKNRLRDQILKELGLVS